MFERRPLLGLLIGLTICVSIWRISVQEPSLLGTEGDYHAGQFQQHAYRRQFSVPPTSDVENSPKFGASTTLRYDERDSNGIPISSKQLNISNSYYKANSYLNLSSISYLLSAVGRDTLPHDDLHKLIDIKNFSFLINSEPCRSSSTYNSPLVLILIHSAANNYMKRLLIRETWGSFKSPYTRLIFLLGAVNSTKTQHRLELENKMFSDIVQGSFVDAYANMTYKHVMALKWFTYYCSNVKFILKIDDDVFVNTPYLIDFLNRRAPQRNLLFCQKQLDSRVKRTFRSKWRVSKKEYAGRYYPPYCPGYAILYSPDVAFRLYLRAQKTRYFWIDDVHITGTLAQQENITITSSFPYVLDKDNCEYILSGKTDKNSFLFLFTWPDIPEGQARKLWKLIESLR